MSKARPGEARPGKSRHRVLYVENAHGVGGSTISLYRLVQQLDRGQYEPVVLFHEPNAYAPRFRELGIEVIVLEGESKKDSDPPLARPVRRRDIAASLGRYSSVLAATYRKLKSVYLFARRTLPEARCIGRVIRSRAIDLVHLNNRLSDNRSAALAARSTRTLCLCHVRDFDRLGWFDRRLAGRVDWFAFMSRALEEQLRAVVPSLQGGVVYDGLELEAFLAAPDRAQARQSFGLDERDFVIGNVGRLVPWKGQEIFLRALAHVVRRVPRPVPNLKALIVGAPDPPGERGYLQRLEALVEQLGLDDVVRFTGFQPDVPGAMAALDVLVHSSSSPEPFGIVVIEGMAAGKPVVATAAGGVLDIVEHGRTGLLTPIGDDRAMAQALLALMRDRDLALRLGAQARDRVRQHFSLQQYSRAVSDVYGNLLQHARTPVRSRYRPEAFRAAGPAAQIAGQSNGQSEGKRTGGRNDGGFSNC